MDEKLDGFAADPSEEEKEKRHYVRKIAIFLAQLARIVSEPRVLAKLVVDINLAAFYFSGVYKSLARRVLLMPSISLQPPRKEKEQFWYLGVCLLLQAGATLYTEWKNRYLLDSAKKGGHCGEESDEDDEDGTTFQLQSGKTGKKVTVCLKPGGVFSSTEEEEEKEATKRGAGKGEEGGLLLFEEEGKPRSTTTTGNPRREERKEKKELTCNVCMSTPARDPSSTPCGHIFCWSCVANWCSENPSCPLCRTACLPCQIWPVYHFAEEEEGGG